MHRIRYILAMDFSLSEEEKLLEEMATKFAKELRAKERETEQRGVLPEIQKKYEALELQRLDWEEVYGGQSLPFTTKMLLLKTLSYGCAASTLGLDRAALFTFPLRALEVEPPQIESLVGRDGWIVLDSAQSFQEKEGQVAYRYPYLPCRKAEVVVVIQPERLLLLEDLESLKEDFTPAALHGLGRCALAGKQKALLSLSLSTEKRRFSLGYLWLYLASLLAGISKASLDYALQYTQEREVFGKKVAHHQGIAFILADLKIQTESISLLVDKAAWELGRQNPSTAFLSFIQATESSLFVTNYGVQLLGGHGYVKDYPVEKWMREARTISLLLGGKDAAEAEAQALLLEGRAD